MPYALALLVLLSGCSLVTDSDTTLGFPDGLIPPGNGASFTGGASGDGDGDGTAGRAPMSTGGTDVPGDGDGDGTGDDGPVAAIACGPDLRCSRDLAVGLFLCGSDAGSSGHSPPACTSGADCSAIPDAECVEDAYGSFTCIKYCGPDFGLEIADGGGDGDGDGDGGVACTDCTPIERGVEGQCPEGGCDFVCPGSYECTATCEGGGCTMTGCAEDGYCSLSCRGGGCAIECDQWVDVCGYYGPHTTCTGLGCPEEVVPDCALASNTTCGESTSVPGMFFCGEASLSGHVPLECTTDADCTNLSGSVCMDPGTGMMGCFKTCTP